ncbi:hypothetical protein M1L60_03555 [Actinoplanes sp. TRM 88003]|uniref:Uncharacterized protein n=1 Tax=Paractinoplanes aksuensis TaxID=2939490 RepID=A0ABT1DFP6_9ACTN|nr:hypothetical protein [Actinoplanes aksuensis]MCO8269664.1 hypothetical protein [Actinoplanes aksuensis]
MKQYVIPRLPGEWEVASRSGGFLCRRPVGWLACCVTLGGSNFSSAFDAKYLVVFLAKPEDGVTGRWQHFHRQGEIDPYWPAPAPTSVPEAEGPMLEILDLIRDQALPYFDRSAPWPLLHRWSKPTLPSARRTSISRRNSSVCR